VPVDGRQVTASPNSNPDLLWAIRGGGGNFGVLTALEYQLHPVTDVLAGTITYAPGRIPELLEAFAKFVATLPDEMNVVGEVLPSEDGPKFHMLLCHFGEARQGNDLLRPLQALKPQQDTVRLTSYLETQTTINPYAPWHTSNRTLLSRNSTVLCLRRSRWLLPTRRPTFAYSWFRFTVRVRACR
jgi:hypothetical protein